MEGKNVADSLQLAGECAAQWFRALVRPRHFHWQEMFVQMQRCGPQGLPIVGLINFLIGVILAFQGATQLRQLGADIFIVDLVTVSVARQMAPMMTAIIVAGRTSAAYAATIANMKVGEELDALHSLEISPVNFLVLPRLVACTAMMPLLVLYGDLMGILGGFSVASAMLDIPWQTFLSRTQSVLSFENVAIGLSKSFCFGLIISFVGCLRGLQAERTSAGVGAAATSAVVTTIVLLIAIDAVFGKVLQVWNL